MRKKRKQVNLSVGRGEKSKTGGLTAKGRAKYNRATGSNLKAPVTGKVKPGSKKVSFSGIVTGTSLSATTGDIETVSVSFITSGAITNAL